MRYLQFTCPSCLCVSLTSEGRCRALRSLVRPSEVAHLLRDVPVPEDTPFAERLGSWFLVRRLLGELRYAADPPGCDRWCSPAKTLESGTGDCDDFAILGASILQAAGVPAWVVAGYVCNDSCGGHAWVEGFDEQGWFLLEPTMLPRPGSVYRAARPAYYRAVAFANQHDCVPADSGSEVRW